jgi:lactate permease
MIAHIANELVRLTGSAYPLVSPFIGLLGVFVTGSNTNSNVLFGSLQETVALSLGLSAATMCAAHTVGASVGAALGPATCAMGATAAHIQGEEYKIYKIILLPTILTLILLGIANFIII